MGHSTELKKDECPLCQSLADVQLPDWSGGKLLVRCDTGGKFATNYPAIAAFQELGEDQRILLQWLRDQIRRSPEMVNITKNEHGVITARSSKPLTKLQKKMRSRRVTRPNESTTSTMIYFAGSPDSSPNESRDD
ncbi:MAG: hypothetical protein GKR90_17755 [Pseudomonadales bacterium]|nr:hypothetical protein [Pseudomonadales bacterium]